MRMTTWRLLSVHYPSNSPVRPPNLEEVWEIDGDIEAPTGNLADIMSHFAKLDEQE